jgi:serine protease Do
MKYPIKLVALFGLAFLASFFVSAVQAANLPDFTKLVEEHSEVVVNISTVSLSKASPGLQFQGDMEQIPEFFKHFFGAPYGGSPGGEKRQQSTGSGFVVSDDGYVLTNNHVVEGADEIFVRFSDRREMKADLIGFDKRSDLAVLKVNASDLPVAKLGKSSETKVGEWVFAIGSPFGFDYTVTAGIVSAKGRSLPNESYVPFIQTDVAINPGNSGGPLFNMDGEVIGINSQIYTRSGGFMGVSFAIPMDVAMDVVDQLKGQGYVSRGWLGVLIQEVSKDLADSFGLEKPYGALVAQVIEGSPAEAAGLKAGDVIVDFEGEEIEMSSELPHLVGRTKLGSEAQLRVFRAGEEIRVSVEIGALPDADQAIASPKAKPAPASNRLGVQVKEVEKEALGELNLQGGVQVVQVLDGPALESGVRPGDIIARLNNEAFDTVEDFYSVVEDLPSDKAVPALIIRQGNPSFIVIKVQE